MINLIKFIQIKIIMIKVIGLDRIIILRKLK